MRKNRVYGSKGITRSTNTLHDVNADYNAGVATAADCERLWRLLHTLIWKIGQVTMASQHLLVRGRSLRPVNTFIRIIISGVFEFYALQTADVQPWPACIRPRCHYTQGEVRRRESYFHIENVLLRNNRPPAAVSGQTQVRPRPPELTVSLQHETLASLCFLYYRGGGLPGYDIISAYPQCCYNDDCQTLQSCGLTTNATLLLRKRKRPHSLTEANQINL